MGRTFDGGRLVLVGAATTVLGVAVVAVAFGALQIATGQFNMADVLHRLPKPIAVQFVDDPDWADRLVCDGLDETDPEAVERYAAQRGLSVVYVPAGDPQERIALVEWVYWRDRLVAYADGAQPELVLPSGSCPG